MNEEEAFHIRPNYKLVHEILAKSIRRVCKKRKVKLTGGAIGFYRYNAEGATIDDRKGMRIYPLMEDNGRANFPNDPNLQKRIWNGITENRNYKGLGHFDHFVENHHKDTKDHFVLPVPEDEKLEYGEDRFKIGRGSDLREEDLNVMAIDKWADVGKALDHLFFKSGMEILWVFPVPALTSPSVLIFLDKSDFSYAVNDGEHPSSLFISDLIAETSEIVHFFMYNRLMIEFMKDEKTLIKINDESELFLEFVKSVFEILLPIRYQIDDATPEDYFKWYEIEESESNGNNPEKKGNVENNKHHLEILKFCFVHGKNEPCDEKCAVNHTLKLWLADFRAPEHSKKVNTKWIRQHSSYKIRFQRVEITLNNIYRLLHKNWNASRNALMEHRRTVASQVEPILGNLASINPHSLTTLLADVEVATRGLSQSLESLKSAGSESSYQIKLVAPGIWKIVFEGKEWFSKQDIPCQYLCIVIGKGKTKVEEKIKFGWSTIAKHYETTVSDIKTAIRKLLDELLKWEEKGKALLLHFGQAGLVTGRQEDGKVASNKNIQPDMKYNPVKGVEWDLTDLGFPKGEG